jgi:hypothetical protein
MICVHTQVLNSASVKANVFRGDLKLKLAKEDLDSHLRVVRHISAMDKKNSPKEIQE